MSIDPVERAITGLGAWAAGVRHHDLADVARVALAEELANLLAVTAGGHSTADQRALVDAWDPEPGTCTLVGATRTATVEAAAWLNTVAAVCLERDSGHRLAQGHPAALSMPAVLALAERLGADGPRTLAAVAVAYEVSARIGHAATYDVEHHTHASTGAPGAAAGCAVLLGLDGRGVARAVHAALAGVVASSWTTALAGSTVRDQWAGAGAVTGLAAARLAATSASLPGTGLPAAVGRLDVTALVPDGGPLLLGHGYLKRHSACAYTHAAADAALLVRGQVLAAGAAPSDVRQVRVATSAAGTRLAATTWTTRHGAYFSTPFAVASALVHGDVAHARSDPAAADVLAPVAARVELEELPAAPGRRPARVRVSLADGRTYEAAVEHSLGDSDLSPFDERTRHGLLTQALGCAGAPPFAADLVLDVVRALPTAARAAHQLARLRRTSDERSL